MAASRVFVILILTIEINVLVLVIFFEDGRGP